MKKYHSIQIAGIIFTFACLFCGCYTVGLLSSPENLKGYSSNQTLSVGIMTVRDICEDKQNIGNVGSIRLKKAADFEENLTARIALALNSSFRVNIKRIAPLIEESEIAETASKNDLNRIVRVDVYYASVYATQSYIQEVFGDIQLSIFVYNRDGRLLCKKNISGHVKRTVGTALFYSRIAPEMLDAALHDTVRQIVANQDLKLSLSSVAQLLQT
ncbi:MAG: hypothetical protein HY586_03445 [Candidatus Omnitrophica bacterium]|nr:hypothetical protein [Candidatus Omnitrophota bacterium]